MIDVANLSDRSHAVLRNLAGLARRQLHQRVLGFLGHQLRRSARRAHHLSTLARLQFQIMNLGARRNIPQRQRVAHQDVSLGTAQNLLANLQPFRLQDVPLLAIGIRQQRDTRRAVRIVLDRLHRRWNPGLVTLEVNDAQLALVAATDKPHRDVARVAPSTRPLLRFNQRLVRMLRRDVVVDQRRAISQRLRSRSVSLNRHKSLS